jgi:hypothetical protein
VTADTGKPGGTQRPGMALDEDPDEALAVIQGRTKGSKAYAAICLADAIRHGDYPGQTTTAPPAG